MRKRIYIYRRGATDDCALTGAKDDPRLPSLAAPARWHFWMQIGPLQPEHREYGFDIRAAVQKIAANGYYLFTGSRTLLRKRPVAQAEPAPQEGQTDA
jgi:hypothetical protein